MTNLPPRLQSALRRRPASRRRPAFPFVLLPLVPLMFCASAPAATPAKRALARDCAAALSSAQAGYLALAKAGIARAERRFRNARLHWYDSRLHDRDRYPLATIWDIVPLFQSLDAVAIAQPSAA